MVLDPKKRQKKMAERAAKRKEKKEKAGGAGHLSGLVSKSQQLAGVPVHECLVPIELFKVGLGSVVFTRKMKDGQLALASILLDVFCLGVKDATFAIVSKDQYESYKEGLNRRQESKITDPSCVRKLVEGAVEYARDLGFEPHRDYKKARQIFGDYDPEECPDAFAYGRDGLPCFISGPYDTPARCKKIIDTLTRNCGEGNFHIMMGGPGNDL
ncbi:MAG: hypothetical protein HQK58_09510 [Deltaproteobacteria bacterium]|nr:hypothetical protein [Deltaproteobacteria bacterium]